MALRLFNTLGRRLEPFSPVRRGEAGIYSCGPTVYDYPHVGNYRAFLFVDVLKRYLTFSGVKVRHVMNITDVDDKVIDRCRSEKLSLLSVTDRYRRAFLEDCALLRISPADEYPSATGHIGEMIRLIGTLLEKGYAYAREDGSVFFDVSRDSGYGRLVTLDTSSLEKTERVAADDYGKKSGQDFSLWKGWKPEDGDVRWDAPWGRGRPGWHIECSAMARKFLGEEFDIHCGGVDLIFPHHENEIAQSFCGTGRLLARVWLHSEHLLLGEEKMSKSLNNVVTVGDLVERGHSVEAIRYLLLTAHYRQKIHLTEESLKGAAAAVSRLREFRRRLSDVARGSSGGDLQVCSEFAEAMDDDLNIAGAMGRLFDWVRRENCRMDEGSLAREEAAAGLGSLMKIDGILQVMEEVEVQLSEQDRLLLEERERARTVGNWGRADEIRRHFAARGLVLEDTPGATKVKIGRIVTS